jgi:O-antigen/teichoic acid export membrane protein
MHSEYLVRLLNLALRLTTMASKFLLIFALARFLEPGDLGLYGLLAVTIGYALYLLGFDFYAFATREMLKRPSSEWGSVIKNQGALSLAAYALFLPALCLLFALDLLPWHLALWFFPLLVIEHITQELGRLLVAISAPLWASWVMFLRSGCWAVAITVVMFFETEARNLHYLFAAWIVSGAAAVLLGCYKLNRLKLGGWQQKVDWRWISKGLKIAIPLLLATLALRALFTTDRYWFEYLNGMEALGAYVLFAGLCAALLSFLDAGVFVFLYPSLISAHHRNDSAAFQAGLRKMLVQTLLVTVTFSLIAIALLPYLLGWIAKPLYIEQSHLFPWLLVASVLYALGMIPHYALYAQGRDRAIVQSHLGSLLCFATSTWLLSNHFTALAVPMGLCIAFAFILLWKSAAFFQANHTPSLH